MDHVEWCNAYGVLNGHYQVVASRPIGDVVRNVIQHVRFPLISSDYLTQIEKENDKSNLVPVSDYDTLGAVLMHLRTG